MTDKIQVTLTKDEAFCLFEALTGGDVDSPEYQEALEEIASRIEDFATTRVTTRTATVGVVNVPKPSEKVEKTERSRLIDISPLVSSRIQNWPGDVPYTMQKAADIHAGAGIDIGSMSTSFHVGAHTDAPRHYTKDGADAANVPIDSYFGPCQVVDVRAHKGKRFGLMDVVQRIESPRVLFKTGTFPDPLNWNNDFAAPEPELIDALAHRGVVLVGFDTPSTDLFASKGLESHQRLAKNGMMNLEGLVLDQVEPGHYTLIALPLRLEGADASPVRAVLVDDGGAEFDENDVFEE